MSIWHPSQCPYCGDPISYSEPFVVCNQCTTFYHPECWQANQRRCSVHGCQGAGELPIRQLQPTQDRKKTFVPYPTIQGMGSRLERMLGAIAGAFSFGAIAWFLASLIPLWSAQFQTSLHLQNLVLQIGIILCAGYGVFKGLRQPEKALQGFVFGPMGYVLCVTLSNLAVSFYSYNNPGATALPSSSISGTVGRLGFALSVLYLPVGNVFFRGGVGAVLSYYLTTVIGFIPYNSDLLAETYRVSLLAISIAVILIAIFLPRIIYPLLRIAVCAVIFLALFQLLAPNSLTRSIPQTPALFSLLILIPLLGVPSVTLSRSDNSVFEVTELLRQVLTAIGRLWLMLIILGGSFFVLQQVMFREVDMNFYQSVFLLSTLYAFVFVYQRTKDRGAMYNFYRTLRTTALVITANILTVGSINLWAEILVQWPVFHNIWSAFVPVQNWVLIGGLLLGSIFVLIYRRDDLPFIVLGTVSALWIWQIILLGTIVAFIGNTIGVLLYQFLVQLSQTIEKWHVPLLYGLTYLGFVVILLRALHKWRRSDLTMIVDKYRKSTLWLFKNLENRINSLLRVERPIINWWIWGLTSVCAILSIQLCLIPNL